MVTALVSHLRATPYNNFVLLAQALLSGHAWIDWPGGYIDALPYNGQYFVIEGPLPALLLMPMVAIFGSQANQTGLAVVLAAVAIGAAWELGERFGLSRSSIAWICAFLLAGTDLLWCAMLGDVWFIAHVSAVCFTMLALVELAGKRRGWLVALFAACAFESRFSMIAALPVYLYLLLASRSANRGARTSKDSYLSSRCSFRSGSCGFSTTKRAGERGATSAIRLGTIKTKSECRPARRFDSSICRTSCWSFFVQLPTFLPGFPWLRPEFSGVALTWTSPALLLAFFARRPFAGCSRFGPPRSWLRSRTSCTTSTASRSSACGTRSTSSRFSSRS